MRVLMRQFGPAVSEKDRRKRGMAGDHSGCWINEWDCGAPDCIMRILQGEPRKVVRNGKPFRTRQDAI